MKTGKIIAGLAVLVLSLVVLSSMSSAMNLQATNANIGVGSKYMATAYGNGTFVEIWYSPDGKYMNATAINSTTGAMITTKTISQDVYTYNGKPSIKPVIVYVGDAFIVAWVNSSKYLEAIGFNSTLAITIPETTINDTTGVSYKGIALAAGADKAFFVWSDSSYQLEGRFMNDTYHGSVFRITNFDSVYQQAPWVAYDPATNNFMVTWVNVTQNATGTKFYNVTGKIFNGDSMSAVTGDILIANAYADQSSYSTPTVCGGNGTFFVTYITYLSPYNINGVTYSASNGNLVSGPFLIGTTYKYGRSPMPTVYDGNGFVVAWSNSSESILATSFDINGNAGTSQVIYNGTNGGNPVIAYDYDNGVYFFSWTEYNSTTKTYSLSSSIWTSDEFVPEFNFVLPVIAVVLVGMAILRRKH